MFVLSLMVSLQDGEHPELFSAHKEETASRVSVSWPLNKLGNVKAFSF